MSMTPANYTGSPPTMPLPSFRRTPTPRLETARPDPRPRSTSRGYDYQWEQFSRRYRRANPFCRECGLAGRLVECDAVDHIVPLEEGGQKFARSNLQPICNEHHNGWKRELERAARELGDVWILQLWCHHPETRPPNLRPT